MKKLLLLFIINLFLSNVYSQTQTCDIVTSQPELPAVGANLEGIGAGSVSGAFMDMVKQSTHWNTTSDEDGWPIGDFYTIFQYMDPRQGHIYNGTYKLSFTGKAVVSLPGADKSSITNIVYDNTTNTTTADINLILNEDYAYAFELLFNGTQRNSQSPINSGITNLKLTRPTTASLGGISWGTDPDATFTKPFLDNIKRYTTLRFMDWNDPNNEFTWDNDKGWLFSESNWSDRRKPSDPHQDQKVAWEYCIELANLLGKDMWINIPLGATPDYVTSLATLLKNTVNPGVNIYFEISNELWNWGFGQSHVNDGLAISELNAGGSILCLGCGPNTVDPKQGVGWIAARRIFKLTREFSKYFRAVYGDAAINTTIRPVVDTQAGWPGLWLDPALEWYEQAYGINSLKDDIFAIAYAPYFELTDDTEGLNKDQIIDQLTTTALGITAQGPNPIYDLSIIAHGATKARWYNVKFLAYEGGPSMYGNNNMDAKIAAQFDPRMKDLVYTYLSRWFSYGAEGLFNWYVGTATGYGQYGQWGVTNDITIANPAKIQGIDSIMKTPIKITAGFPSSAIIDARQFLDYDKNYQNAPYTMGNIGGSHHDYLIRVDTAGTYAFAASIMSEWSGYNTDRAWDTKRVLRVMIDNEFVDTITPRPTPWGVYNFLWTDEVPGDSIKYFLNPGLHVLRFVCDYPEDLRGFCFQSLKFERIKTKPPVPLQPGIITASKNPVCQNENNITYSVPAIKGLTYDWTYSGSGISTITSKTNSITINFSATASSGKLSVFAKNSCGIKSKTSSDLDITVNTLPEQPGPIDGPSSICKGQMGAFNISPVTGASSYKWNYSLPAGVSLDTNNTDATLSFTSSAQSGTLTVSASNSCGTGQAQSKIITLDNQASAGNLTVPNNTIEIGKNTSITANNISGSIIKWQLSRDDSEFRDTSVSSTALNTGNLNFPGDYYFRIVVGNGVCPAITSNSIKITVIQPTSAGIAGIDKQEICSGENIALQLTGYDGTVSWQDSIEGGSFKLISGSNSDNMIVNSVSNSTWYRAMVEGTTGILFSNIVQVIVNSPSKTGTATADLSTVVKGNGTKINLSDFVGNIQWESSLDNLNFLPISNELNATLNTGSLYETTYYRAIAKSGSCFSDTSNTVKVSVEEAVKAGTATTASSMICEGSGTTISLRNYSGSIQWERSVDRVTYTTLQNETSEDLILSPLHSATYVRAKITNMGSSVFSNVVLVQITKNPDTNLLITGSTVCFQSDGTVMLQQSQKDITYQAYVNQTKVGSTLNGTGEDLIFTISNNLLNADKTNITIMANANACPAFSLNKAEIVQQTMVPKPGLITGETEVCPFEEMSYSITPLEGSYDYVWKIPAGTSATATNGTTNKITYNEKLNPGSVITVRTKSGECLSDTTSLSVKIKTGCLEIFVPNIITPNSADGNAQWVIQGLQSYPTAKVKVMNRWGSQVYESETGYPKAWDGNSSNGQQIPNATYYYVIELKSKMKALTGSITIMR